MSREEFNISEFRGRNTRDRPGKMDPRFSPDCENWDLSRNTLAVRDGCYKASFNDPANTKPVDQIGFHTAQDGTIHSVVAQSGALFAGASPQAFSGTWPPTVVDIDSTLSTSSYPVKWRSGDDAVWMQQQADTMYLANGQDTPQAWEGGTEKVRKWGVSPPKQFNREATTALGGVGVPAGTNNVYVETEVAPLALEYYESWINSGFHRLSPGSYAHDLYKQGRSISMRGATERVFYYGTSAFAFTYVYRSPVSGRVVESNPSPIVDFSNGLNSASTEQEGLTPTTPVGKIHFQFAVPDDPKVTAVRIYKTLGVGETFKQMGEWDLSAGVDTTVTLDVGVEEEWRKYWDNALVSARQLEYDHNPPPMLAGFFAHKDRMFGWERADRILATGEASTGTGAGDVISSVVMDAPGGGALEAHIGHSLRFTGVGTSDRHYVIVDADEDANRYRIGVIPGDTYEELWFDELDALDESQTAAPFVIESVGSILRWSKRGLPEYWPAFNYRPIDADSGEEISSGWVTRDRIILAKKSTLYLLNYNTNPGTGGAALRRISESLGCEYDHAYAHRDDGSTEFQHDTHICITDGAGCKVISDQIFGELIDTTAPSIGHSVHYQKKGQTWHTRAEGTYVHNYRTGAWMLYTWKEVNLGIWGRAIIDNREEIFGARGRYIYIVEDSERAHGAADGLPAGLDATFTPTGNPTGTATAAGGNITLTDLNNTFRNWQVDEPVRIISGPGAGEEGKVASWTNANEIVVSGITNGTVINPSSTYEFGAIHAYWLTPNMVHGSVEHIEPEAHIWYEPAAFAEANINEPSYTGKYIYIASMSGWRQSAVAATGINTYDNDELEDSVRFQANIDSRTGEPLIQLDGDDDRWLVDYTNANEPMNSATAWRENANPGHAHVPCYAQGPVIRIKVGSDHPRSKVEIYHLGLVKVREDPPR